MIIPLNSLAEHAFFLDFDGTLVPIAEKPDAVVVSSETIGILKELHSLTRGATAVISGRPISALEQFLSPLDIPIAGSHGLELKLPGHPAVVSPIDRAALTEAVERLKEFVAKHDGLLLEEKPASVALHYRQAPERQRDCELLVEEILHTHTGLSLVRGKMVLELKAGSANKAQAMEMLMKNEPFHGRLPVFAGDDVTDEDAFHYVNRLKGTTIKIGPGETQALHRLPDVPGFLSWLGELAANGPKSDVSARGEGS